MQNFESNNRWIKIVFENIGVSHLLNESDSPFPKYLPQFQSNLWKPKYIP
jgi:hypothetical protein